MYTITSYEGDNDVDASITRINPRELTNLVLGPEIGTDNDCILFGNNGRKRVAIKVIIKTGTNADHRNVQHGLNPVGHLRREAHILHAIQSVVSAPTLYGVIQDQTISLADRQIPIDLAIVMECAQGESVKGLDIFTRRAATKEYFLKTRVNVYADLARHVAEYYRGILDLGFMETDIQPDQLYVVTEEKGILQFTKIDCGAIHNRRDTDCGFDREFKVDKYNVAIEDLLLDFIRNHVKSNWGLPFEFSDILKEGGLHKFPRLINRYYRGKYVVEKTDSPFNGYADDTTFLEFLPQWEEAMKEFGQYLIR